MNSLTKSDPCRARRKEWNEAVPATKTPEAGHRDQPSAEAPAAHPPARHAEDRDVARDDERRGAEFAVYPLEHFERELA